MSQKRVVNIPKWELVDINLLKVDGDNPNRMTEKQLEALGDSFLQFGFVFPIITNKDYLIADGEHKLIKAKELGMEKVPVVALPVSDVDRRLLRQVLNKLKGSHSYDLDAKEMKKLYDHGRDRELKKYLDMSDKTFNKYLEKLKESEKIKPVNIEDEDNKTMTSCPKCSYIFNPDNFMIDSIQIETETYSYLMESDVRELDRDNTMIMNVAFKTATPEINERVSSVSEAFGIGIDETVNFEVFKQFRLSFNDDDLIYITGDSGSGKTTFLRHIEERLRTDRNKVTVNFDDVEIDEEETVIDGLGSDVNEAMSYLSSAGMSEAFLMLRRYKELSDGQKYRYRLAKMLSKKADAYFIDELGATLDRVMARVIAFNLQKWARRERKMIVSASTHHDLIEDFNPDVLVFKGFGEEAQIRYYDYTKKPFSLVKDMKIEEATKRDYEQLERFHYLGGYPAYVKLRYKLTYKDKVIGVILYTTPFLENSMRTKALPEYRGIPSKERAERINRDILRLSRIIIHPKFRGVGLAVSLVADSMKLTGFKVIETLAAMSKYNPFFEKAGMTRVGVVPFNKEQRLVHGTIEALGGDPILLRNPKNRREFVDSLDDRKKETLIKALMTNVISLFHQGRHGQTERIVRELAVGGLESLLENLLSTERVYLYWKRDS